MYAIYWLAAAAVFLLIEILTLGLTSIWFAGGAFFAAITAFAGGPLFAQLIVFIVVTCLLFVVTRPLAKKYLNSKVEKTNAEALIGQRAVVKEAIENRTGRGVVLINGQEWSAKSLNEEEIPEDTDVVVREIRGVNLLVEAASKKEEV